ncbi:MAG TPA: recombination protein RecR [Myxococcales bacterium]|nr:recombination protein RecR [Myxococcales bacterium]
MTGGEPLERVVDLLSRLPGVGRKTATRHAYHLLRKGEGYGLELADALTDLVQQTNLCERCQNYARVSPCSRCTDPRRDHSRICVVQSPQDVTVLENSGAWNGSYHVLHGVLAPLDGVGPEDLKIRELLARFPGEVPVEEVVVATGASVEGEATAIYLAGLLSPTVQVTRLARGLPAGGDLEYVDGPTLQRALEGRQPL